MIQAEINANNMKVQELADEKGMKVAQNVAAGVAGVWTGMIRALHESRSRSAARRINQHRHLIDAHRAHHTGLEMRSSGPVQP